MSRPADLQILDARASAASVLHPLRRSILERLQEPDSASGLARRLGVPRQKVNYHLRELEKDSLVQFVEERRRGNCVERLFHSTARSYLISPETLGKLAADPERVRDRFSSAYLMAMATRVTHELALLRRRADKAGKRLATLAVQTDITFASAADRNAFTEELTDEIARLVARYHRGDAKQGRRFKFVVGGYPCIKDTRGMR